MNDAKVYADLPGYNSPSIITGDEYRPDMLLLTSENTLYVAELTVGHESNLENNSIRKKQKYSKLACKGTKRSLQISYFYQYFNELFRCFC